MDINPEGVGIKKLVHLKRAGFIHFNTGFFIFNNYPNETENTKTKWDTHIWFIQSKYTTSFDYNMIIAPGLLMTNSNKDTDLSIDYQIFTTYIKLKFLDNQLIFTGDYFYNFKRYNHKINPRFQNQKTGYAIEAKYYFLDRKFTTGLKYAYIEKYAVIDRLAQNDWVGNTVKIMNENGNLSYQYDKASNFRGINLSLKYKIQKDIYTQIEFWKSQDLLSESSGQNLAGYTKIHWQLSYRF